MAKYRRFKCAQCGRWEVAFCEECGPVCNYCPHEHSVVSVGSYDEETGDYTMDVPHPATFTKE